MTKPQRNEIEMCIKNLTQALERKLAADRAYQEASCRLDTAMTAAENDVE